jgi:hypothetical protein
MSGPSETRLGPHPARGDGGLERREVSLVLVSVRLGERGHRPVEGIRLAELRAYRDPVARACVGARGDLYTEIERPDKD